MGKSRFLWLCFTFLKLTSNFRRSSLSRRSLIIATVCVIYLFFVVLQVGHTEQHGDRRTDKDKSRHSRGLYNVDINGALPDFADLHTGASFGVPTRSNVVYITLKTKRLKPVHIRGTIRPKLRRKVRRNKTANSYFTQNKVGTLERGAGQIRNNIAPRSSWKNSRDIDYKSLDLRQKSHEDAETDSRISSIRIYSQMAPPWFSAQDVKTMRFLADAKILRMKEVSQGDIPSLFIFEGETGVSPANEKHTKWNSVCGGQCGVIHSPVDNAEVFAFHLDRVLGLNRTLPAVSRKFSFLHDGQSHPVVSWDSSLYPEGLAAGWASVRLTWRQYQSSLKLRCWHKNNPKPDSGCSTIHHYEWSILALFDFLLQIHNRLDQSCCGFRPRREDTCVELGLHAQCLDQDHIELANIVHRGHDPRHLVFTNNKGFFDRNEDNLDFRLLEGIKDKVDKFQHTMLRNSRFKSQC
ncbi:Golgi-associated kinase 1B isoform X2 [Parambassis ranga]|uniref:Golgi-associated kinase 1B isoform X2 n=1 Tax=Parambassis ranga TaxID=210632 RepID=A0A6P7J670_9TELE|nr:Golgi-associated kinase 1B isoform X2 [Parambassis ranga]